MSIEKEIKKEINVNSDPVINAFINDYSKEEEEYLRGERRDDELLINFNITYNDREMDICPSNNGVDEKIKVINASSAENTGKEYEKFYKEIKSSNEPKVYKTEAQPKKVEGTIKVKSVLNAIDGEPLKGVKINLYVTNGVSPRLVKSGVTDEEGIVIFENVDCGNYRVIEIIDKVYFEKPIYKKWNEVYITADNNYEEVTVINNIKTSYSKKKN